jgi:Arc/MetJ-type ribon-helix-helix transcriptional regulator
MARRVSLFVTCIVDQIFPRTGIAMADVLERLGYMVDFPRGADLLRSAGLQQRSLSIEVFPGALGQRLRLAVSPPPLRGMVTGMATTKVTITLPNSQLNEIQKRVAAQETPSVSAFIQQAVQKSLENAAAFRAMVDEGLKATGGPLKSKERVWAKRMLSARRRRDKPGKAA